MSDQFVSVSTVMAVALAVGFAALLMLGITNRKHDVFISYRRQGGATIARLIKAEYEKRSYSVFLDVADLDQGRFDSVISAQIKGAPSFLLILSETALHSTGQPNDWLLQEVREAIDKRRNIVPLLLPGFRYPTDLPPKLESLPRYQSYEFNHALFDETIGKLVAAIRPYGRRSSRAVVLKASAACVGAGLLLALANIRDPDLIGDALGAREEWVRVEVRDSLRNPIKADVWKDIFWTEGANGWHKGWLAGVRSWDPRQGILLYTDNVNDAWEDVTSSVGVVGPITSLEFLHERFFPDGDLEHQDGVLAAYSGIYRIKYKRGSFLVNRVDWRPFNPAPPANANFERLAFIGHEIYAAGWAGIQHWTKAENRWRHEFVAPREIRSIFTDRTPDDPEVWAVGRGGDAKSTDRGAIYRLIDPVNRTWRQETLPLDELGVGPNDAFSDITLLDRNTVVVVGDKGLIIRGLRDSAATTWKWQRIDSRTNENLLGIYFVRERGTLWTIGEQGAILRGRQNGTSWRVLLRVDMPDKSEPKLTRIRFHGSNVGWIVGRNVLLRYVRTETWFGRLSETFSASIR
jgi:hypothetical protein